MTLTRPIRVVIVEDSAFARQALIRIFSSAPDIEVAGVAVDGMDGVAKTLALRPDVVTMDIKMPRLGGLDALRQIMAECPTPVLLLSSLTSEGADITLRGLDLGAMDFVDKSRVQGQMNLLSLAEELLGKVRALAGARHALVGGAALLGEAPMLSVRPGAGRGVDAVAIATSTGGPPALQTIIPRFPEDLTAAILVVQHMPPGFTRYLAERLATRSALPVREAEDGENVAPGHVLIAPAGHHMKLRRRGADVRIWLDNEPRSALHKPSADVLMRHVADVYGHRALGVVLTGMGSDGVEGLRAIKAAGGSTLAESEETCVIYGMPKAAQDAGVVDRSVALDRMADEILAAV
jgi:two-component system chemotaxis response regulator CheB